MSSDIIPFMNNFKKLHRTTRCDICVQYICKSFWYDNSETTSPIHPVLVEMKRVHINFANSNMSVNDIDIILRATNCTYLLNFLHGNPKDFYFVKRLETHLNSNYETIIKTRGFNLKIVCECAYYLNLYATTTNTHIQKIRDLSIVYILSLVFVLDKTVLTFEHLHDIRYIRRATTLPNIKSFFIDHIKNNIPFNTLVKLHRHDINGLCIACIDVHSFYRHLRYHYNNTLRIIKKLTNSAYDTNDQNYKLYFDDVIINGEINYDKLLDKTFDADIFNMAKLPTKNSNGTDAIKLTIQQYNLDMMLIIDV